MTKVQAIKKLMEDNNGIASWSTIYDELEKYYPKIKQSKEWKAGIRGVLYRDIGKNFKKIDDGLFSLIDFDEENYVLDNNVTNNTEKLTELKVRVGQKYFRGKLLKKLKYCPFTRIDFKELLIASHIKPWTISNDFERLDIYNGFLFTPTYDKLFDRGYISFKNDKSILISNAIRQNIRNKLNIKNGDIIQNLIIEGREKYLEYHRDVIYEHND